MTTIRPRIAATCLGLFLLAPALAQERASFRLAFAGAPEPARVEARFEGCAGDGVTVAMPAWKPGSYTIRDFGQYVAELAAVDGDGTDLDVQQVDTNTWRIATGGAATVVARYVLATRNGSGLGSSFSLAKGLGRPRREKLANGEDGPPSWSAYEFEGPATWLYVPGHVGIPHRVVFDLPDGWNVATGMRAVGDDGRTFDAPDYDVFADCPFHVGTFETRSVEVAGTRYEIVWSGFEHDRNDRDAIAERYRRIFVADHALWGDAPFDRYVFLIGFPGGGGLEHLNSTNLGMLDLSGSTPGRNSSWDSLVSHEFFHAWNVKRLRPKALGPFDYSGPNRTRYLWFSEGVTSYMGDLLLVRAGVWDAEQFWEDSIAGEIRALQSNPGRLKMSIAEASWTVWDFPYMRRGRTAPDYYNKGELLGLLLDVEIRDATDGERSLDDVLRRLYAQCMESGEGFADGDVCKACEAVAGRSFEEFFARYVDGTDELPFAEALAKIGLEVLEPGATDAADETEPRPRGRRGWQVRILDDAPERAVRLREGMTRRVG